MIRLATATALLAVLALSPASAQEATAAADMAGPDGTSLGKVTFEQSPSGMVHVTIDMSGLEPGTHGFHVHETGKCDGKDGFKSAGGHYAGGMEHGIDSAHGPHAGDFPNVEAGKDGTVKAEFFTDRLSLAEGGKNPLVDEDGSAVVLHAKADDYKSQPAGDAGDRVACGVIEKD